MTEKTYTPEQRAAAAGFCLQQLIKNAHTCFVFGAADMQEIDPVAARNVAKHLVDGTGEIVARISFTQGTCAFYLCIDHAGEDAQEIPMFTQSFKPAPLAY